MMNLNLKKMTTEFNNFIEMIEKKETIKFNKILNKTENKTFFNTFAIELPFYEDNKIEILKKLNKILENTKIELKEKYNGVKFLSCEFYETEEMECELCGVHSPEIGYECKYQYIENNIEKEKRLLRKYRNIRKKIIDDSEIIIDNENKMFKLLLKYEDIKKEFSFKIIEKYSFKDILNKYSKEYTKRAKFAFINSNYGKYFE